MRCRFTRPMPILEPLTQGDHKFHPPLTLREFRERRECLFRRYRPWWKSDERYDSKWKTRYEQTPDGIVCCIDCEATMVHAHEAVRDGWSNVEADHSVEWDFLGLCPECQQKQEREESAFYQQRGMLF